MNKVNLFNKLLVVLTLSIFILTTGCNNKNMDPNRPIGAEDKRRKTLKREEVLLLDPYLVSVVPQIMNLVLQIQCGEHHLKL